MEIHRTREPQAMDRGLTGMLSEAETLGESR